MLRRPFSINTADPATGIVTLHFRTVGRGTEWLTRAREGERLDMLGPLGRPFEVDPRSRHLLLIAGGLGMAGVRMLADEAVRDGRQVVVLFGALSAAHVYPSSLLPDEVEYVVATDDGSLGHHGFVTELVADYEAWADQAFACGPHADAQAPGRAGRRAARAAGRRQARAASGAAARPIPLGSAGGPAQGVPAGLDGADDGLRRRRVPGLRRHRRRRAAARLPRGPGLRGRGDRLGVDRMKAEAKRSITVRGHAPRHGLQPIQADADGPKGQERHRAAGSDRGLAAGRGSRPARRPSPISGAPVPARPTLAEREALDRIDLSVELAPERGPAARNPIIVASGTFGYGVEYGEVVDVQRIGAICCKGTTLRPRAGNPPPRVTETPGGMLNSIGLQNPGVDAVIEKYGPIWQGWKVPVIVNVAGESIEDYVEVARRLDGVPGVAGIELNISCPNVGKGGLQFAIDRDAARAVTAAVRRATDLPLLVKLSPNVADVRPIAKAIEEAGADAITAINTLSGLAVSPDRTRAFLGNTYGGLSGPAIKPVALRIVYEVAQVVSIPIVAIGGVTNLDDVLDFLACGAVAVQVGTAIFADPELPVRLGDELRAECLRRGLSSYAAARRHGPAQAHRRAVRQGRRVPTVSR